MNEQNRNGKQRQELQVGIRIPNTSCVFDGVFTGEVRRLMREKREALGASQQQVAPLLCVHHSTLRKWESGVVTNCQPKHYAKVASFLQGEFDRKLRTYNEDAGDILKLWTELPESIHRCVERALTVYRLCTNHPDLQNGILNDFNGTLNGTVRRLLDRAWPKEVHVEE